MVKDRPGYQVYHLPHLFIRTLFKKRLRMMRMGFILQVYYHILHKFNSLKLAFVE